MTACKHVEAADRVTARSRIDGDKRRNLSIHLHAVAPSGDLSLDPKGRTDAIGLPAATGFIVEQDGHPGPCTRSLPERCDNRGNGVDI